MSGLEKRVTVTYPNHHNVFTQRIWEMFTTKCDVDLNLVTGTGGIAVHQLIVKLFIPTISSRLTWTPTSSRKSRSGFLNQNILDLALKMDEDKDLELLIEFVYRGTLGVTTEQLQSLKRITTKFSVPLHVDGETELTGAVQLSVQKKVARSSANKRKGRPTKVVQNVGSSWLDEHEPSTISRDTTSASIWNSPTRYLFQPLRKEKEGQVPMCSNDSRDNNLCVTSLSPSVPQSDEEATASSASSTKDTSLVDITEEVVPIPKLKKLSTSNKRSSKGSTTKSRAQYHKQWRLQQALQACPHCDFETRDKRLLLFHLNAKHDPGVFVFRCGTCNRMFQKAESLERHAATHADDHDIYRCDRCDYSSIKKINYHRHLIESHKIKADGTPADERFRCTDCEYTSNFKSRFLRHVQTKHSKKKPFQCDQCPYSTTRKEHLTSHVRSVHLRTRDFVCDQCGRRLASTSALLKHKRTHTGEKPYKCHLCGKTYSQNNKLKTHLERHSNPNEKSYFCHLCGHATRRKDNLREHVKRIHKTTLDYEALQTMEQI